MTQPIEVEGFVNQELADLHKQLIEEGKAIYDEGGVAADCIVGAKFGYGAADTKDVMRLAGFVGAMKGDLFFIKVGRL
jgi:hypothetical protein